MVVDGYPIWSKADNPEVLALYIFSLEQEGHDISTWTYDDFPDSPSDMLTKKKKKSRKRKSEAEGEPKQKKKSKKSKKEKAVGLGTYSEPSEKCTSNKPSSDMSTSSTPQTKLSKQVQTPPSVLISEPIPLNSAPPLNQLQANSEVTLSDQSPTRSDDYRDSDPKSPPTHNLPQTYINPSQSQTAGSLLYDFQGPSTPSEESSSEPISPDCSDDQSSPSHPEIDPSSAIILYQPRPIHLVECINKSYEAASKKALELLASTSAFPEAVQADWMEFQKWLNCEFSCIRHSSEQAMKSCINAASKQRDEKLKTIQEREARVIKDTQEAMNVEAEESLKAEMARTIFLTIEDELLEIVVARDLSKESEQKRREATLAEAKNSKAARLEAEWDEAARIEAARVLAEEDAIRAEAIKKQQAEDQRIASEQAEKDKTESGKAVSEAC